MSGKDAEPRWYEGEDRARPTGWFAEGTEKRRTPERRPVSRETYREAAREVPVHAECDVLVVGGGPSGCAAATAAARLGADVLLVERYGHLGGLSTGGLVFWIDRMTDWSGRQVIAGYAVDALDRLPEGAVFGPARELWGSTDEEPVAYWRRRLNAFRNTVTWSPVVDPEWLKVVSLELLQEAGARLLLHSWAVQAIVEDGRVGGVVFESKQGRRAIFADVVVDASGDLDICALGGGKFESDADTGDVSHCINVPWCFAGVDMDRFIAFSEEQPDEYTAMMKRGGELMGFVEQPVVSWRNDVCIFMGPRLSGYSGIDVDDLTTVEIESRRRMVQHLAFFRAHAPGFERAWISTTASQIGIRHTRRLVGLQKLTNADWKAGVVHADEVGVSPPPSQKFANVSIPYGAILSASFDNLLAGGRHIACDPSTQSFMREVPQCWMTGQAAGVAAGLAALRRCSPRDVPILELQAALRAQGVYLQDGVRASGEAAKEGAPA
jgi:hypothetical protein